MKIGVYVCECGINIAATVDVEKVAEYAKTLPNVAVSRFYKYMCSDPGQDLIRKDIEEQKLDRVVVASCSPRMHEPTFRKVLEDSGLNPYCLDMINIREQCSWAHEDKELATEKAKALVRGAVAKARLLESLDRAKINVIPEALVIGGGIAGIQTSLDLADGGYKVYLVEKSPSIGGRMAQLDKTFPTLDCSSCILTPKMMEVSNHPNIELLTYSEVINVDGSVGNYKVKIKKKPRYVDIDKCTGCGDCVEACRMKGRISSEFDMGMGKRSAIYMPFPQAIPLKCTIDPDHCLMLTREKCGDKPLCKEACEANAINFKQKEEEIEIDVGAIVVATGYDVKDPSTLHEYSYSRSDDVITSLEMERLISSSGPTTGEIIKPSDGEKPKSITFLLCVGSRDEKQPYCSRICCQQAIKNALLIKERNPDTHVYILYRDIRTYGFNEGYYTRAREKDVRFIEYKADKKPDVEKTNGQLKVSVYDPVLDARVNIKTDLLVLSTGVIPREDAKDLAQQLKVPLTSDGFFLEAHMKLRPVDFATDGVFLCGLAHFPKTVDESIEQALAACSRASTIISHDTVEVEGATSFLPDYNKNLCSGCEVCITVCPYKAISKNEDDEIVITQVLCKGCGVCGATCTNHAIIIRHFTDEQILSEIYAFGGK